MTSLWLPSPSALLSAHNTQALIPPSTGTNSRVMNRPNLPLPRTLATQSYETPELRPLLPVLRRSDVTPSATSTLTSLSMSASASPTHNAALPSSRPSLLPVSLGENNERVDLPKDQQQTLHSSTQVLLAACTALQKPHDRPISMSATCSPVSVLPSSRSRLSPSPLGTPSVSPSTPVCHTRVGPQCGSPSSSNVSGKNEKRIMSCEKLRDKIITTTMTTISNTMDKSSGKKSDMNCGGMKVIKKVFHCPVAGCTQTSSNRGNLSKHIATRHEHRKDFACPFEGCTRRFAKKYNMLRHLSASGVHRSSASNTILTSPVHSSEPQNGRLTQNECFRAPSLSGVANGVVKKARNGGQSRSRWSSLELDLARFLVDHYRKSLPTSLQ